MNAQIANLQVALKGIQPPRHWRRYLNSILSTFTFHIIVAIMDEDYMEEVDEFWPAFYDLVVATPTSNGIIAVALSLIHNSNVLFAGIMPSTGKLGQQARAFRMFVRTYYAFMVLSRLRLNVEEETIELCRESSTSVVSLLHIGHIGPLFVQMICVFESRLTTSVIHSTSKRCKLVYAALIVNWRRVKYYVPKTRQTRCSCDLTRFLELLELDLYKKYCNDHLPPTPCSCPYASYEIPTLSHARRQFLEHPVSVEHPHTCAYCGKREIKGARKKGRRFKTCGLCKKQRLRVRFVLCSDECNEAFWPFHAMYHQMVFGSCRSDVFVPAFTNTGP